MNPVTVIQGRGPIILAQPHSGTYVPEAIWENLNTVGRQLLDTDWHIPRLYEGLLDNVTIVRANFSRYVIDANRDPEGGSLYPGENNTKLVPLATFDDEPIWNVAPSEDDIAFRLKHFHQVYHEALYAEIEKVKTIHGYAFVYDCHSIRSQITHLFDHKLPDLNIGDNVGKSCDVQITKAIEQICCNYPAYRHIVNGRFKGGWTTRHYGSPANHIYALQMELAQCTYLGSEAPPFNYAADKANTLRKVLRLILSAINKHKPMTFTGDQP
ncbi:MAG: formiminoglutamase [Bermanella sp.]|jgi:formiminoglutamase